MEFNRYLKAKYAGSTAAAYERLVAEFEQYRSGEIQAASYTEIIDYLGQLRKAGSSAAHLNTTLYAIKSYYDYLLKTDRRQDHPADGIRLKDQRSRSIDHSRLLDANQLEDLLQRKERYPILKRRNQSILELLIYQGMQGREIANLQLQDLNLETGTVQITASRNTNGRELKLKGKQVLKLYQYIHEDRPKLLKTETPKLFIGMKGNAETQDGIGYLVQSTARQLQLQKLSPRKIRQSVIANLLKGGKDLRIVQVFAGHKYPSSTEKYRELDDQELQAGIEKYHPL